MEDIRKLFTIEEGIAVQRDAFIAMAQGRTETAPNSWLRLPGEVRGWLKLLAGYDQTSRALGIKVLARFPQNPPGSNVGSLMVLFDDNNGFPLAIIDGVYVTAVRTGAGAGLATEALAPAGASVVGLIGTGVVAWYSLRSMKHLRPHLTHVRVHSRSEQRRERFAERIRTQLDMDASTYGSVEDAVEGVDIIVTATNSPEHVLMAGHLQETGLVNAMGIKTEVAPEALARCLVIGDGREEALADGKFSVALAAGVVTEAELGPTLGEVLTGAEVPRDRPTLFDSSGVAIQDVASARWIWERAEEIDVGTLVDFGLDRAP